MIAFAVYGAAQPAGSKTPGVTKSGRRFVRDANSASAEWKRQVAQAAGEAMNGAGLLTGPLRCELRFYRPRPAAHFGKRGLLPSAPPYPITRPDALKLARACEDAMTGVVFRDDAQIVIEVIRKLYGEPARVEVWVSEYRA